MPYKDKKKQRLAQRRSYVRHKEAHTIRSNDNRAKRRIKLNEYVRALKGSSPCAECKVQYPYYVMDFDHVRGEKSGDITVLIHEVVSLERLEEEVAKCDIVCSNCHRERTFNRIG